MGIYHDIGIADPPEGTDQSKVRGSDYRARHVSPDFLILSITAAPLILTDEDWVIPIARTELNGLTAHRTRWPFARCESVRLQVQVTKAGKGWIGMQASGDNGATWNSVDGAGGPLLNCNRIGVLDSGWLDVSPTVRAHFPDSLIRLIGEQGTGLAGDVVAFGLITAYAR
jgi:hypothetical protein